MDVIREMQELKLEGMIPSCPRDFPPEIVHEILIRLPAKSLVKCTSVCKTWRSMIINRSFFSDHLTRRGNLAVAGQNGTHLLLLHRVCGKKRTILFKTGCKVTDEVHSLHFDNQAFEEYSRIEFPTAAKEKKYNSFLRVVGVCDGLICLADDMFCYAYNFFIWNPAIRKLVTLPMPDVTFSTHRGYDASIGFGFDATNNDYKVVRIVTLLEQHGLPTLGEVYSLSKGSWTSLGCISPACLIDKAAPNVFVNGALHWPVCRNTKDERNYFILKFDLGREVFRRMSLPHTFKWKFELGLRLTVTGDEKSVALFILDMRSEDSALDIWVMKEYGRKDSWTKLITLGPQGPERFVPRALGFRKCGEVLLLLSKESNHELASLDLVSKEVRNLGISGFQFCSAHFYEECLILLDKTNAESY